MAGFVNNFLEKRAFEETPEEVRGFDPVTESDKSFYQRVWPVFACGAGLFSDGYLNGVIGSVSTMLSRIYPLQYKGSPAQRNVSAITFAGTVLGTLVFGYTADHFSRKWSLLVCTVMLFVFAALSAGSYGYHGSISGLFAALAAWRFLLGLSIGGEYPAGSVGAAESTGELDYGTRNRWFIWATDCAIDFGFVVAAFVPMIVVLATTENHLRAAWRICLGLGIIPPLSLLYFRIKLKEPEAFERESMAKAKTPIWLIIKFYWFRLLVVGLIWFIYDFSAYGFGIYSSYILTNLLGNDSRLWVSFGWNTLINLFYMPGCIFGAWLSDWIGPRYALTAGVTAQAIVGYIMAGCYAYLNKPSAVGGFVVVYGFFLAFGEVGPGDNIGLIASKTSATAIRGQYYGIAGAMGKVGAFVGTYLFPIIQKNSRNGIASGQDPFWVASTLAIFSGMLCFFCLPHIGQDTIDQEDKRFRAYLERHGYDTTAMGLHHSTLSTASVGAPAPVSESNGKQTDTTV